MALFTRLFKDARSTKHKINLLPQPENDSWFFGHRIHNLFINSIKYKNTNNNYFTHYFTFRRKFEKHQQDAGEYWVIRNFTINLLTPNDPYMGRTAPLTSKRCISYIYSTNIGTEYFKYALHSPIFSLQNAVCFIMLTCLVPSLLTFYKHGVLKLKKK